MIARKSTAYIIKDSANFTKGECLILRLKGGPRQKMATSRDTQDKQRKATNECEISVRNYHNHQLHDPRRKAHYQLSTENTFNIVVTEVC